ncbi:MAG: hypothetical protein IAI49_14895, partial [Candidatus Eremiobacteraeota bacterium]|nr:hypothetical protein [Candidatus Eremiobacteraeota bacterium]
MRRMLFVTNGHGETAIAARIAAEIARLGAGTLGLDLFPVVGLGGGAAPLTVVGPRRTMPSGGLVAMGNVRAFSRDLAAGFVGLFARQLAFLTSLPEYDAVVAVGDAYALALALCARKATIFVGTAKSVHVAPYGPLERVLMRRALRTFVRDAETAERLRSQGVAAEAPGNVIVDLIGPASEEAPAGIWLGLLPGSREAAYADGVHLARVARELGKLRPDVGGLFSVAPTLEAGRFASALAADGWELAPSSGAEIAFCARSGPSRLLGWRGDLGGLLASSVAVLGQAGTGNEQAAACGVPVVALDRTERSRTGGGADWYRMRQRRLLGDALLLAPADP